MQKKEEKKPEETTAIQTGTFSQRFTRMVMKEFGDAQGGGLALTPYQQKLAQHMFIGIDKALTTLEANRIAKNMTKKQPITWANVNMNKLAIDSVNRIELGLDALIPNHIHPTPYWNSKLKKYDLDLAIGYAGKDYYKREMSINKPIDIIYELVYDTDEFEPLFKDANRKIESYNFKIKNAFKRGKVIGGFGYIIYDNPEKNKLVLVSLDQMNKAKDLAKTDTFWKAHPENMQLVVVVRRTTDALKVDPKKVNQAYAAVELDDNSREIAENANQIPLDIDDDVPEGRVFDAEYTETEKEQPKQEEAPEKGKIEPDTSFIKQVDQYIEIMGKDEVEKVLKTFKVKNPYDLPEEEQGAFIKKLKEVLEGGDSGKGKEGPGF
jgi:recombination protein RecT